VNLLLFEIHPNITLIPSQLNKKNDIYMLFALTKRSFDFFEKTKKTTNGRTSERARAAIKA
jgi:hypothetical protein